ncbi:MAG TPA: hypothetical protein VGK30_17985 [Candidatus Binatia bacterium]|jgi:hypothetical protein
MYAGRSIALAAAIIVSSTTTAAGANFSNRCLAGKFKCVAKKSAGLLTCYAKAAAQDLDVDPACLAKVQAKFDGGADPSRGCFARLESKIDTGFLCLTTGDTGSMETRIDDFVSAVRDALTHQPPPTRTPTPQVPTGTPTPTAHATPGPVDNRRCTGNTGQTCTSDADCSGVGGTCQFWLSGTVPFSGGGVSTCLTYQFDGAITGTYDVDTGASANAWPVVLRVYSGPTLAQPCPPCQGDVTPGDGIRDGACQSGVNAGMGCDANGASTQYGPTSLDCPPLNGALIGTSKLDLSSTTGTDSLTLAATSPDCTAPGFGTPRCIGGPNQTVSCSATSECPGGLCQTPKCACSSCNDAAAEPCSSDADCPDPPGPLGPVCGGKHCFAGSNVGAGCNATSECPGSACARLGANTAPNQCDDSVCSPDGGNEGTCSAGPLEQYCGPGETFRQCATDSDCPRPGDTCSIAKTRDCFRDNGMIGNGIIATGSAGVPVGHQSDGTLASAHCAAPTQAAAANASAGLPGPERLEIPAHVTDDGGASCPTTVGFFLTSGSAGIFDRGWTGLGHDGPFAVNAVVTFGVTGCTGSPPSCGSCSYAGPIPNP